MEPEVPSVDEAPFAQTEYTRMSALMLGTAITIWTGIRDAYYGSIDQIEQALCAP